MQGYAKVAEHMPALVLTARRRLLARGFCERSRSQKPLARSLRRAYWENGRRLLHCPGI